MSLNLLKDSNHAGLDLLDWNLIISNITSLAHFDNTKERFNISPSYKNINALEKIFDALDFFLKSDDSFTTEIQHEIWNLPSTKEYFNQVDLLSKGKIFSIDELNFIAQLLESNLSFSKKLKLWNFYPRFELDQSIKQKLQSNFVNRLRQFVDSDGTINYYKHPLLKKIYREVNELEKEIRNTIQFIARNDRFANALQFKEHDVINDRFVLAVRSDSYNADLGPIIAKSSTGMTLFVEPKELKEKANIRIRLLAEIEAIISKITQEFSEFLHQFAGEIKIVRNFILEIDYTLSKSNFVKKYNLSRPKLSPNFVMELWDFFHPLIEKPITNTIFIEEHEKGLILSGPNTGGKTVALKAITLCQLMMQMGLFVPARVANIFPVQAIFYFSSDQQNIAEGLSSFASETISYLSIFDHFEDDNLIVVDEIFNSTSSEEASALAIAFLEEIHKKTSAKVLISTHHQLFKTFIHGNDKYISAHVGHDDKNNLPTYKIFTGEPGSSMAFSIFSRIANSLDKTSNIPLRAGEILDNKHISYEKLLQDLSSKKAELERLLVENRELNQQLKNQKKSMEGLVTLEKQRLIEDYKRKMDKKLKQAENLIHKVKSGEIATNKQFNKQAINIKSTITREEISNNEIDDNVSNLGPTVKDVQIGARYHSVLLGKEIEVTSINERKNEVTGICQKRSINCPVKSLRFLKNTPNKFMPKENIVTVNVDIESRASVDLDLRGMRLDDFKREVEIAVTELINGQLPFLNIIHGHGTGVLKKWLREYLKGIKEIHFQAEDGNDGCTHITRT